jgi:N6-L-threonylcarbamoyladenine synthase
LNQLILGIDTSNYTTSAALTDPNENILFDIRKPLEVKLGARGLRQNEAFFQHVQALPSLTQDIFEQCRTQIAAVAVSDRPRNADGSYMPVFTAGQRFADTVAESLGVPVYRFSHQEGHIAAGTFGKSLPAGEDFCIFHLSGGTFEILITRFTDHGLIKKTNRVGGSLDISMGQFIDRAGVALGLAFPAGAAVDRAACAAQAMRTEAESVETCGYDLPQIRPDGLWVNLSGIDSAVSRIIREDFAKQGVDANNELFFAVMHACAHCLDRLTEQVKKQYNIANIIFAGGVASSTFLRKHFQDRIFFADATLGADNAVGIALLGGRMHGVARVQLESTEMVK